MVIECLVSPAYPEPVVTWYKNGNQLTNSPDYQIYYNNGLCTLIIAEVFPEDAGKFTCNATTDAGTQTSVAYLKVDGMYY